MAAPAPDPVNEKCATCFYARDIPVSRMRGRRLVKESVKVCAYDPPRLGLDSTIAAWPEITSEQWCGNWSPDGTLVSRWDPA